MSAVTEDKITTLMEWELAKRQVASDGFVPYCEDYCSRNGLVMAKHQYFMAKKLELAMTTPDSRLMIKMPPGHSKSTYSSILAPTYFLGRFPKKNVIMTTHTQEFSDRWGRRCRGLIQEPYYDHFFNVSVSKDSAAVSRFDLTNGSTYFGSGILGNFTGLRSDLIIGDDWYRGIEEADSETIRQKIWEAYVWDLRTRLKPGGSIVLIGTPWHEDDHFGRILTSKDKDSWEVIELPALAFKNDPIGRKEGDPLWPEYITLKMLTDIRDSLDKEDIRMWNSLYQVSPTVESGDYFKKEWIKTVNRIPPDLSIYGASDYAVSAGRGDYTVHAIVGHDDKNDDLYIIDIWREQAESNIWVEKFLELAKKHKTIVWAEESGQIIKSLDPFIRKEMETRKQYVYREQFTSVVDKTTRARSFQAYMAQGKVYILNAEWTRDLERELLSFPSGKNDDQVDSLSLVGRLLDDMRLKQSPAKKVAEFEYRSNMIMLPELNERVTPKQKSTFKKI
jgi:predicted phage terminase large subunit-like protein